MPNKEEEVLVVVTEMPEGEIVDVSTELVEKAEEPKTPKKKGRPKKAKEEVVVVVDETPQAQFIEGNKVLRILDEGKYKRVFTVHGLQYKLSEEEFGRLVQ